MASKIAVLEKEKKDWQAEDDWRALCRAEEIREDAGRLKRAIAEGQKQCDKAEQALIRAKGLKERGGY